MCCFSPVTLPGSLVTRVVDALLLRRRLHVSRTRIFARMDGDRQGLIYEMALSSRGDVAMILPLPVKEGAGEDAVEFVDLSNYPTIFDDLEQGFGMVMTQSKSRGWGSIVRGRPALKVHRVGAFSASFVPTIADFSRLDARFRIADEIWQKLPDHQDYGFAVFQLERGFNETIHPMAFWFPTRAPERLFFPTLHIHGQHCPKIARFDHSFYYQEALPDGLSNAITLTLSPQWGGTEFGPYAACVSLGASPLTSIVVPEKLGARARHVTLQIEPSGQVIISADHPDGAVFVWQDDQPVRIHKPTPILMGGAFSVGAATGPRFQVDRVDTRERRRHVNVHRDEESTGLTVDAARAQQLMHPRWPLFRRTRRGRHLNLDTWVDRKLWAENLHIITNPPPPA